MQVHRDIKLDNVMVSTDGRAKLVDFGVAAKVSDTDASLAVHVGQAHGGNVSHLCPEVLTCGEELRHLTTPGDYVVMPFVKQASFALGVLFHELATGEHPIEGYPGRWHDSVQLVLVLCSSRFYKLTHVRCMLSQ